MRILILLLALVSIPASAAESLRILLTNDDGFNAPGIRAVQKALVGAGHDVYLVAPATQQSGMGSAITAGGVRVTAYPDNVWAVHGKPSDAVRVGLGSVMEEFPPDLVVSGANLGQNVGQDILVSGTVGAAIAAHNLGFPAIALSVGIRIEERNEHYPSTIAAFTDAGRLLVRLIHNLELRDLTSVLNVNYPPVMPLDVRGVRWARPSSYSVFKRKYLRTPDGIYRPHLQAPDPHAPVMDAESLMQGYVTLTFLDGDMSVEPKRGQRHLERFLVDREFEPTQPVPTRRPPPKPKPPEPKLQEVETAKPVKAEPAANPVEREEPAAADLPPETAPGPRPLPPSRFEKRVIQGTAISTGDGEDALEQPEEPTEPEQEQRRKKPDSWLRRLVNPKRWGD